MAEPPGLPARVRRSLDHRLKGGLPFAIPEPVRDGARIVGGALDHLRLASRTS